EHKVGSLALEFRSKGAALFGHLTPRSGEHSRLNGCPVSLDHYNCLRSRMAARLRALKTLTVLGGFLKINKVD
ncbi:hypothetical protein, partial [Pseudomonas lundensis]|uniref:hypothetical protein n=1 Tax=Pseudomonas lundensis TaxID=86185 RepID=UPI001CA4511E